MYASAKTNPTQQQSFPKGLKTVALLMILFGLAEIASGITHNFMGLTTVALTASTIISASVGICSAIAGLLVLTKKRIAAMAAIGLLGLDVVGRIVMVVTGFYPMDSEVQSFAIILGTSIVVLFGVHLVQNIQSFE